MGKKSESSAGQSQLDKFKEAARELDCDESAENFSKRLGKLVNQQKRPDSE
jgi:hypothetical protein